MNDPLIEIDADVNHYGMGQLQSDGNMNQFTSMAFNDFVGNNYSSNRNSLSILHMNIRSISKNYDNFVASLDSINLKFDVIAISESWLKDSTADIYFPGYSSYHSTRPSRSGGGTALYIKNHLLSSLIIGTTVNNDDIECVFAEIRHNNGKVVVGSIYRPPSGNVSIFQNELCSKLSMINSSTNETVLCGDYNLDLLKINSNANIADFYQSALTYGLSPSITSPTHICIQGNGQISYSLLDNILTSNRNFCKSGILEFDITDHFPIFILFDNIFHDEIQCETIEYRSTNDSAITKFIEKVSQINFEILIPPNTNINDSIVLLYK